MQKQQAFYGNITEQNDNLADSESFKSKIKIKEKITGIRKRC